MPYSAFPALKIPYDRDGTLMYLGDPADSITLSVTSAQMTELNDTDQVEHWEESGAGAMRLWWFFPQPWQVTHWYAHIWPGGLGTLTITLNSIQGSNNTSDGSDGTWETATLTGGISSGIGVNSGVVVYDQWRTGIRALTFTQPYRVIRVQISNTATSAGPRQEYTSFHWYGTKPAETHDLVFLDGGTPVTIVHDFGDIQRVVEEETKAFALRNLSETRTAENVVVSLPTQSPATQGVSIGPSVSGPWDSSLTIGDIAPEADSDEFYVRSAPPLAQAAIPRVYPMVASVDAGFFD